MIEPIKITLIILAKDEEELIGDCIDWHNPYVDEIIVVDGHSTDKTVEIARSFRAKVLLEQQSDDFAAIRNYAMEVAENDWSLHVDSDERYNRDFLASMKMAIELYKPLAFRINRKNLDPSDTVKIGDYQVRLINRKFCVWKGKVHETVWDRYSEKKIDEIGQNYIKVEDRPIIHLSRSIEARAKQRKRWNGL